MGLFSVFKKKESSRALGLNEILDKSGNIIDLTELPSVIDLMDPDSFEARYCMDFIKTKREYYANKDSDYYSSLSSHGIPVKKNNMRLLSVIPYELNLDFHFVDVERIIVRKEEFGKMLISANNDLQKRIEKLGLSQTQVHIVMTKIIERSNYISYDACVYSDYDLYSLNCYLSERYRLKYTTKEYRQDAILLASVGDGVTLEENGPGRLLCNVDGFPGVIGEIGVNDSKAILPYINSDKFVIVAEVAQKILNDPYGAIVQVDIYDNPLNAK